MEPLLDLIDIWKSYQPGVYAVRGVSLTIQPGEIHGLMGGNGAGKSTLMKIIAGAHRPDQGTIRWRGNDVTWPSPHAASSAGVSTVHQNVPLAPALSALENVFLTRSGFLRGGGGLREEFEALCERTGFRFDPDVLVSDLSIGQRQMVAIMQALSSSPDLLVLDEPTASLAEAERVQLFETMQQLANEGTAILFCSHFINEVLDATERVTIMRGGEVVISADTAELTPQEAARGIAGRTLLEMERKLSETAGPEREVTVEIRDMQVGDAQPFDLEVHAGEILGLAGLMGSGQSHILRQLFAAEPLVAESAALRGQPVPTTIGAAVARGIAYVGEDRARQSLFPQWEIWRNLSLPQVTSFSRLRVIENVDDERAAAQGVVERLSVKTPSVDALVSSLSGGNAQKVAIGRWLERRPEVLLLDDPTVGVDVGAKADILAIVADLAASGTTVILTSSDFNELAAVSHRIAIVVRGSVSDIVPNDGLSEAKIVALINGYTQSDEEYSYGFAN
jgi:ribose transport system ATP-binding protein